MARSATEIATRVRNLKIIRIGNSRGIRLPKSLLDRYGFAEVALAEETDQGILLRARHEEKLSWEETYRSMSEEAEEWHDFDIAMADGLDGENGFDS